MFESLTGRLGDVFDRLRKRGALSEVEVKAAMREIRVALLEADVALPVVRWPPWAVLPPAFIGQPSQLERLAELPLPSRTGRRPVTGVMRRFDAFVAFVGAVSSPFVRVGCHSDC